MTNIAEKYNKFQNDFGKGEEQNYDALIKSLFTENFQKIINGARFRCDNIEIKYLDIFMGGAISSGVMNSITTSLFFYNGWNVLFTKDIVPLVGLNIGAVIGGAVGTVLVTAIAANSYVFISNIHANNFNTYYIELCTTNLSMAAASVVGGIGCSIGAYIGSYSALHIIDTYFFVGIANAGANVILDYFVQDLELVGIAMGGL